MSDDIREWAASQGMDISATGRIPADVRKAYQARETEAEAFPADEPSAPGTDIPFSSAEESAPKQPKLADRAKQSLDTAKTRTRRARKATVTKKAGPRASIESILAGAWGVFATGVGKVNPAVGFIMVQQAPVAGMLMEDSVKGTVVDKVLQPFAQNAERARVVRALLGPPLLVAFIQSQPDKAPLVIPQLRKMLADYIDIAGPKMAVIMEREAEFEDKYGKQVDDIIEKLVEIINVQNAAKQQHFADEGE
jgi:Lsr2